jgi:hypothetical protein
MNRSGLPQQRFAILSLGSGDRLSYFKSAELTRAGELVREFPWCYDSNRLVTICSLACGFLLYVLFQSTRETKGKPRSRPAIGDQGGKAGEKKQLYLVTVPRHFPESRREWSARSQVARSPKRAKPIETMPSRLQSLRTDRARENC